MDGALGALLRVREAGALRGVELGGRESSLLATCRADLRAVARLAELEGDSKAGMTSLVLRPGVWAVLAFRVATALHHRGFRLLSRPVWFVSMILFGSDFQAGAVVGPGLAVSNPVGCGFAHGSRLGRDVTLVGSVRIGGGGFEDPTQDGFPTIGDGCWLLEGAKVFGPVDVGAGSVVGVNVVVTKDVPAGSVVAGMSARVTPRALPGEDGHGVDVRAVGTATVRAG